MHANAIARSYTVVLAGFILVSQNAACGGRTRLVDPHAPRDAGSGGPAGGGETGGTNAGPPDAGGSGEAGRDASTSRPDAAAAPDAETPAKDGGALPPKGADEPWYLKASNPDAQDWFGTTVALHGEWLAVGAPNESSRAAGLDGDQRDDSEDRSGAVYLFSTDDSGWSQRNYVKASNPNAGDGFGYAIALSERTLAVGAPHEDSPATGIDGDQGNGDGGNHGAVYVFVLAEEGWKQEAYIKASNTDWVDLFGTSVALDGDVLVVGAPWEDSAANQINGDEADDSAENSGAVYVFSRGAGGWTQTAYLKASNAGTDDEFGKAVAISGEMIVVGAPGESGSGTGVDPATDDDAAPDSGAVYVFERSGTTYRQTALLKASNADAGDGFGDDLAFDGNTIAVGAVGEATSNGNGTQSNEAMPDSGAVYVFERGAGSWAQTAYLKAVRAAAEVYFGTTLAISGDTLIVGAFGEDRARLPLSGAAYVYGRNAGAWSMKTRMTAPIPEINDRFGAAVALTPSLMAIGVTGEASDSPGIGGDAANNRAAGAGAVFVYAR